MSARGRSGTPTGLIRQPDPDTAENGTGVDFAPDGAVRAPREARAKPLVSPSRRIEPSTGPAARQGAIGVSFTSDGTTSEASEGPLQRGPAMDGGRA
jgi:hypothetical protein